MPIGSLNGGWITHPIDLYQQGQWKSLSRWLEKAKEVLIAHLDEQRKSLDLLSHSLKEAKVVIIEVATFLLHLISLDPSNILVKQWWSSIESNVVQDQSKKMPKKCLSRTFGGSMTKPRSLCRSFEGSMTDPQNANLEYFPPKVAYLSQICASFQSKPTNGVDSWPSKCRMWDQLKLTHCQKDRSSNLS